MTRHVLALVLASTWLAAPSAAQPPSTRFSGIKLVDLQARTPERTVTMTVGTEGVLVEEAGSVVARLPYGGLVVSHDLSSAPPASAGDPAAAATGRGELPTYMGKAPRNWLTLSSGDRRLVLRVSSKVYDQVRDALSLHQVTITETR